MFCPSKDKVLTEHKANVIYEIICPGCGEKYIGKTDRCFKTRMLEHGKRADQPMHQHLFNCNEFHEITNLFSLPCLFGNSDGIDYKEHIINTVLNNCKILDSNDNYPMSYFVLFGASTNHTINR